MKRASKSSNHRAFKFVAGVALVALAVTMRGILPELVRYFRIRRM